MEQEPYQKAAEATDRPVDNRFVVVNGSGLMRLEFIQEICQLVREAKNAGEEIRKWSHKTQKKAFLFINSFEEENLRKNDLTHMFYKGRIFAGAEGLEKEIRRETYVYLNRISDILERLKKVCSSSNDDEIKNYFGEILFDRQQSMDTFRSFSELMNHLTRLKNLCLNAPLNSPSSSSKPA